MPQSIRLDMSRQAVHNRQQRAWQLRQNGLTYAAIAEELGYTRNGKVYASAARNAVLTYAKRQATTRVSTRSFGVEIELQGLTRSDAAYAVAQALGVDHVHVSEYHSRYCDYCSDMIEKGVDWTVERDGSVSNGCEVITPALTGVDGYETLKKVMRFLSDAGGRVSRSCGMHVHFDVTDMDGHALAAWLETWTLNQSHIDALVSPSRRGNNTYTMHLTDSEAQRLVRDLRAYRDGSSSQKYKVVNFGPIDRYGTVEVRQHQGTLNGNKAVAWIRFVQGLLDSAKEVGRIDREADVNAFIDKVLSTDVLDPDVAAQMRTRARQIASRSRR